MRAGLLDPTGGGVLFGGGTNAAYGRVIKPRNGFEPFRSEYSSAWAGVRNLWVPLPWQRAFLIVYRRTEQKNEPSPLESWVRSPRQSLVPIQEANRPIMSVMLQVAERSDGKLKDHGEHEFAIAPSPLDLVEIEVDGKFVGMKVLHIEHRFWRGLLVPVLLADNRQER